MRHGRRAKDTRKQAKHPIQPSPRSRFRVPDRTWARSASPSASRARGKAVSEHKLAAFLEKQIARYKVPKRLFCGEALPKSGFGKGPKRMIRDELADRDLLDSVHRDRIQR